MTDEWTRDRLPERPTGDVTHFADGEERNECYASAPTDVEERAAYFQARNDQMGAAAARYFAARAKRKKDGNE